MAQMLFYLALSGPLLAAQPPVTDSGNLPPKDNVRPKSRARLHGEFPCAICLDRSSKRFAVDVGTKASRDS
jgi:hypothetical protein